MADHYGWGVYGYNLFTYGLLSGQFNVVPLHKPEFLYPLDPLTEIYLSGNFPKPNSEIELSSDDIFLSALGNEFNRCKFSECRNIGLIFFESNPLPIDYIKYLKEFEFIVAGSNWNASLLLENSINAKTIIQGVDLELFKPSHKRYFRDRFVIFSGGKLEYRKGQDILLKAYSIFSKKYKDALLITAWGSPWQKEIAETVNQSELCSPIYASDNMQLEMHKWILNNGVDKNQFICLKNFPNRLLPDVFREIDLAVFPNRCEGGTNLVAMEALAFDIPCAISNNTGHRDLIIPGNCFPLFEQEKINTETHLGWGESSVDELLAVMEDCYHERTKLDPLAARNSMYSHSWESSINSLISIF
jgi:glycosyltransferase involved in cell wall biosynthesis